MTRQDFDADQSIADQEAYDLGMLDAQEGHARGQKKVPAELEDAYTAGQDDYKKYYG